jgi:hypothetical protein
MRSFTRVCLLLAAALTAAAGLSGCSDAYIASRDNQHTPSVPPAQWENNPMNLPTPGQRAY